MSQPGFLSTLGDGFAEAFGDRSDELYSFGSWQRAGITVAGSSDAPVITADPRLGIRDAILRRTGDGRVLGPAERLTARDALALYTTRAAFAARREDEIGSLEPGKLADFAVLDANPLDVDPEQIPDIGVLATVVGGDTGATIREASSLAADGYPHGHADVGCRGCGAEGNRDRRQGARPGRGGAGRAAGGAGRQGRGGRELERAAGLHQRPAAAGHARGEGRGVPVRGQLGAGHGGGHRGDGGLQLAAASDRAGRVRRLGGPRPAAAHAPAVELVPARGGREGGGRDHRGRGDGAGGRRRAVAAGRRARGGDLGRRRGDHRRGAIDPRPGPAGPSPAGARRPELLAARARGQLARGAERVRDRQRRDRGLGGHQPGEQAAQALDDRRA